MGSLVVYGMLAYSIGLMVTSRALRVCIVFVAISLVIAIGFSRIYLGVHYFSDVIAGYLAASFWLEKQRRQARNRGAGAWHCYYSL